MQLTYIWKSLKQPIQLQYKSIPAIKLFKTNNYRYVVKENLLLKILWKTAADIKVVSSQFNDVVQQAVWNATSAEIESQPKNTYSTYKKEILQKHDKNRINKIVNHNDLKLLEIVSKLETYFYGKTTKNNKEKHLRNKSFKNKSFES